MVVTVSVGIFPLLGCQATTSTFPETTRHQTSRSNEQSLARLLRLSVGIETVSFLLCGQCWQPKARSQLVNGPCAWWSLSTTKHNITLVSCIQHVYSYLEQRVAWCRHTQTQVTLCLRVYNKHGISSHHHTHARTLVSNTPSSKIPWWSCWLVLGRPRLWAWFGDGGGGGG